MEERYRKDIDELEKRNAFWNAAMSTFMIIFALMAFGLVLTMFLSAF